MSKMTGWWGIKTNSTFWVVVCAEIIWTAMLVSSGSGDDDDDECSNRFLSALQ